MAELKAFLDLIQAALKDHLFTVFREPAVAVGLALVFLAVGILIVGWLIFVKWMPFYMRLRRLIKIIRKTPDELGLIKNFPIVDEAIRKTKFVRHGWQEFKETLVFPEPDSNGMPPEWWTPPSLKMRPVRRPPD